ncbi:uncharacterized protein LOC142234262 [Haematobia irritans]|uniref:uncharacterized protein LOC142234262 n=1 Tax=Haematobia irritans TaxID=7368 RepID=UPI003F50C003
MRFFIFAFAAIAAASAASISSEYLTPVEDNSLVTQEYIPPNSNVEPAELSDDGYRYQVVRKLRLRNRRDVNELPSGEYLPPAKQIAVEDASATQQEVVVENVPEQGVAPVEAVAVEAPIEGASQETSVLANDGYRYKTVRRIKYRHRRDVNELASNEYLPPVATTQQEVAVESVPDQTQIVEEVSPAAVPEETVAQESSVLANDGYRYKTVRRIRYRQRRDVSELANNEYLPPHADAQQENVVVEAIPEQSIVADVPEETVSQESAVLANDGYRYKTVRRIRYRQRRDVSELASNEYLPPHAAAQQENIVVEAAPEQTTVVEDVTPTQVPVDAASQESSALASDGYRYKTVRRIRYRYRRDVNELPEYLPPVAATKVEDVAVEAAPEQTIVVEEVAPEQTVDASTGTLQDGTTLASDGYRYKTVRRIRYRHRRDVNELVNNEYLPPVAASQHEEIVSEAVPEQSTFVVETIPEKDIVVAEAPFVSASQDSAILANDGYRYKTVRRIRYRHRRDVSELAHNEYLPPVEASTRNEEVVESFPEHITVVEETVPEQSSAVVQAPSEEISQDSAVLTNDGYRYKTVRRIRYRHRRDVNELSSNEYLPPNAATQQQEVFVEAAPQETAVVEEVLPEQSVGVSESAPQDSTILATDGYRYKTIRRIRYRHRRDVSELPINQYLPPAEAQTQEIVNIVSVPEESSSVLADDGYRYKAVHKLKHRRH